MHKKLSCLNGRAKRKQDVRVADEYFLIKLVTWSRKQDLRVVDKYFLIKPVTWTRNEIVNTYQSRLGKNQINFFCLYNQNTDSVTRDGGRGGGGRGNTPKVKTLRCVTCVMSSVKVVGRIRLELALLCARFQASSIHSRIGPGKRLEQPPLFQACIGQWTNTLAKMGASFPFWPWQD